ncbi:ribosomal RNA-processing protein 8 [Manduca sexta]|uniref:Ribosomal RNA-processing protein 8 n=1 Tax=Manduca sexta TaxID=7130 RepID=A0A921YXU1_MANSE|nr:ribosomal RNA-processing protein 8 [Manduca sexta]KAG6447838.1 hypothetical protein O3G_MSEX005188 [Manduca sexta]
MFKVPEWGDDVPKVKANFAKKSKKSKKQTTNPALTKQSKNISARSPQNENKKKKKRNKKQKTDSAETSSTPNNVKGNGPRFVSKKINGDVPRKVFNNKKNIFNDSNNEQHPNKTLKLKNKFNKRPETNIADKHKTLSKDGDDQNIPKKGKKRKKRMSKNKTAAEQNSNDLDEGVSNAKKKKLDDNFKIDDQEDLLFAHNNKAKNENKRKKDDIKGVPIKVNKKKEKIKQLLENQMQRTPIITSGNKLRDRMLERLKAAQFRYINEKLYTSSGSDAQQLFQNDPAAFQTYHEGYQQQVKKWPVNPLNLIVQRIQKMPKTHQIADMGCGEAALSKRIPHKVRSFDLVATSSAVEVCDIAHTPLLAASMDVAVYCLALMGTDLTQYLVEANRVLKIGGYLLIAEVESRFNKVEDFTKEVERLGFKLKNLDKTHQVFFFMEFTKIREPPAKKSKLPVLTLKPCLYKRR